MIISHKHKYLFVELPRTGSTAISKELCEHYDGRSILYKHSTYCDFLRSASPDEKKYFVFSCIRNPMDVVVSLYVRYKNDQNQRYTDPAKLARHKGIGAYADKTIFKFIQANDADFADYFLRFYRIPYNTWAHLSHRDFDFIIRYESLANDFSDVLRLIGIEPRRPLPLINKTDRKSENFSSYYTPRTIRRAQWVFGSYMQQWGYKFPAEWDTTPVSWFNQAEFEFINYFRNIYWRYLRYRVWPPQQKTSRVAGLHT
jgi:hypothetical protein